MGTIATIARLTVREAGRKRLLLAGVLLGAAFVLVYATALYLILTHAPCGPRGRPCATAFERLQFHGRGRRGIIQPRHHVRLLQCRHGPSHGASEWHEDGIEPCPLRIEYATDFGWLPRWIVAAREEYAVLGRGGAQQKSE